MGIIRDYRDAVLATITAAMPEFKDIGPAPGTFTDEMIKRFAMKSPACKVAWIGHRRTDMLSTGEIVGPIRMAAYIITEDEPPIDSFDVAMDLAEKLAGVIEMNSFDFPRANPAVVEEIQNLYSFTGERRGTSLAAVSWEQQLRIGVNLYELDTADELVMGTHNPDGLYVHEPSTP